MVMPNFLVLGAQKAGTSALSNYLNQHPQIYMSPEKELHFFAFEGENLNFHQRLNPNAKNVTLITDLKSYQQQFQTVSSETAIGEASPSYLPSLKAPERIKHYIPSAKLIAILRDPVERAYSNFLHCVRTGAEPLNNFVKALREEEIRTRENWGLLWQYKQQGFYYIQVKRYFDLFERNQIKIILYEEFSHNPVKILQEIFRFLDVDYTFVPNTSVKYNVSGIPRNKVLHNLLINPQIKNISKQFIPQNIRYFAKNIKNSNLVKPQLSKAVRQQLIPEYKEDILKLQDLIKKDLSKWLN